ncbi:SRPBCC family protein [Nocardioides antri]|uniref:SRPBCC family protein n=1 Tax=Nocardioides antri TaxID=2607659 RepID=A0A5B1M101_9ACTN|nr:SRPBCC family protein [Nocardioides antri]KAA1426431.1 SRPBCC family protein [Nocardioides antri]
MASFTLTRDAVVDAPPARVHAILEDFHAWEAWSPWEEMDPHLERSFSGADKGVGAHYAWSGNKSVGKGSMEITRSTPERIEIDLEFVEPFKASNQTAFDLTPAAGGTRVEWTMTGERNVLMTLMGKLYFDKAIAKDFDRGLAKLRAVAEAQP